MARWEPDARGRLEQAAMELYGERGFDETTVADIAARAGLTERTFFRHYADKREVLFWGARQLQDLLVKEVTAAPASMAPLEIVVRALETTSPIYEERREFARVRQALIVSHAELLERELIKLATLASALGEALRERGVPGAAAGLAAETGIALFKLAFQQWVSDARRRSFAHHLRDLLGELKVVTAGRSRKPSKVPAADRSRRPSSR